MYSKVAKRAQKILIPFSPSLFPDTIILYFHGKSLGFDFKPLEDYILHD